MFVRKSNKVCVVLQMEAILDLSSSRTIASPSILKTVFFSICVVVSLINVYKLYCRIEALSFI